MAAKSGFRVSVAAMALGLAFPATAQTASAPDATGIEEIIVTATRRETRLIDTPASIAVISPEYLERTGTINFRDLGFSVPNFSLNENSNSPILSDISIRGIGGAGRVGYYVDDVLVGTSAGFNQNLVDIARVEFLRGPQGVAFGRNTLAGAINIVTKTPSLDKSSGFGAVGYGNYNNIQGQGSVTGPLVPGKIGLKIAGSYRSRDGYDRIRSGGRGNDDDGFLIRAGLLFKVANGLDLAVNYTHGEDRASAFYLDAYDDLPASPNPGDCSAAGLTAGLGAGLPPVAALFANCSADGYPSGNFAAADGNPYDRVLDAGPQRNHSTRNTDVISGKLTFDREGVRFTSISAYTDIRYDLQRDQDYTPADSGYGIFPNQFSSFSQEVRVGSSDQGRFDWLIGAYYYSEANDSDNLVTLGRDFRLSRGIVYGLILAGVPSPTREFLALQLGGQTIGTIAGALGLPPELQQAYFFSANRSRTESLSGYGTATYRITDRLSASAGVRWTSERLQSANAQGTNLGPAPTERIFGPESVFNSTNVSPTASLLYKVTNALSTYATFGTGFYRGAANNPAFCALINRNPCDVKPEKLYNYELGVKGQFLDRKLSVNLAGFYLDYQNLQRAQSFFVSGQQISITGNIDKTEIYGLELESVYRPINDLNLFANVGYSHSEIKKYPGALLPDGLGNTFVADVSNVPLPLAPQWTVSGGGQYDHPLSGSLTGFVAAEVQYRSEQIFNLAGRANLATADPDDGAYDPANPFFQLSSQTNVNLRAGVRGGERWTLTARVYNLLDASYVNGVDGGGGGFVRSRFLTLSPPRTFSAEFRVNF